MISIWLYWKNILWKKYFAVTILGGHMMTFINVLLCSIWIDTGSQSYANLVVDMFKKLLLIIHFKCFKTKYSVVSLTLKDTQDKKNVSVFQGMVFVKLLSGNYYSPVRGTNKRLSLHNCCIYLCCYPKIRWGSKWIKELENYRNVQLYMCETACVWETSRRPDWPSLTSPLSVRRMLAPCRAQNTTMTAHIPLDSSMRLIHNHTLAHTQTTTHRHTYILLIRHTAQVAWLFEWNY